MTTPSERASIRYAKPEDRPGWVRWAVQGVVRVVTRVCNTYPFIRWRSYGEYMWKGALKEPVYTCRTFAINPSKLPVTLDVHITANPAIMKVFLDLHRNGPTFSTQGERKQAFVYLMEAIFPYINATNNDSMLSCDEEHSKRFRGLLHKAFTLQKIQEQEQIVRSIIDSTLTKWGSKGTIDLQKEMKYFTAELVGKLFLGFDGPYDEIAEAINSQLIPYMSRAGWAKGNTTLSASENAGMKITLNTIKTIFDNAKNPDCPPSLIKTMIAEKFSDQEISAMILTLLIAGQDTTASLLNYILIQVALDPALQHFYLNGTITTKMLIAEGIRMMPPASFIARVPGHDLVVQQGDDATLIYRDSLFAVSPVFLGKNPSIVSGSSPNLFVPNRWTDKELPEHLTQLPWLPMGSGAHECVGHKVANFNMTLLLEKILKKYALSTSLKKIPPNVTQFTTRLEGSLSLTLKPRIEEK